MVQFLTIKKTVENRRVNVSKTLGETLGSKSTSTKHKGLKNSESRNQYSDV